MPNLASRYQARPLQTNCPGAGQIDVTRLGTQLENAVRDSDTQGG